MCSTLKKVISGKNNYIRIINWYIVYREEEIFKIKKVYHKRKKKSHSTHRSGENSIYTPNPSPVTITHLKPIILYSE